VIGTEGHLTLDPGYEIWDELKQEVTRGKRTSQQTYPHLFRAKAPAKRR
jgi:hypothetical protein